MQAVIMHPDGVDAGLASEAARRHLDVAPDDVEQVVSRSLAQTSVERLSIYANAYYARLLECLGEEFPVLKQTLGEETFDAFAFDYLQRYPSQSYTLGKLGENFARYLRDTRPAANNEAQSGDASDDGGELPADWPDFLIELATVEWIFSQVFDGPGI
ncbi:MAG TPA: DNA-binding domain-containing protein, partial [Pirellulales bacterium]